MHEEPWYGIEEYTLFESDGKTLDTTYDGKLDI